MEQINTQQNKSMIWDILYKNNIFDNLAEQDMPNIINIIDNVIINTEKNIYNKNRNLIELNKIIIQDVNILINQYKTKNSTNTTNSTNSTNNKTIKSILKSEIRETIDDRFNIIKNDLDTTINVNKPQEINFKDDISHNNTNLDKDLEELIKRRNNINNNLSLIYDKKTEINTNNSTNTSTNTNTNTNTNTSTNTNTNTSTNTNTNTNTNTSNIPDIESINNKILDFDNIISSTIDNSSQTNLYDTSLNNIKIIELLEIIKINQDKILNLINK